MQLRSRLVSPTSETALSDWENVDYSNELRLDGDFVDVSDDFFLIRVYANTDADGNVTIKGKPTKAADLETLIGPQSVPAADGQTLIGVRSVEAYSYIQVTADTTVTVDLCAE